MCFLSAPAALGKGLSTGSLPGNHPISVILLTSMVLCLGTRWVLMEELKRPAEAGLRDRVEMFLL